jgi:hypothetical protein
MSPTSSRTGFPLQIDGDACAVLSSGTGYHSFQLRTPPLVFLSQLPAPCWSGGAAMTNYLD